MASAPGEIIIKAELRPARVILRGSNDAPAHAYDVLVHTTKEGPHGGFIVEQVDGEVEEVQVDNRTALVFKDRKFDEFAWDVD